MNIKTENKVLVVANDAGGGEILAAYIKQNPAQYFISYVAGPAARIFEREGINFELVTAGGVEKVIRAQPRASLVLTGTGWMTLIERLFIAAAKAQHIPTVAFLDHWVNYRERFGYPESGWESNLPDEIWVGDEAAEQLARDLFPGKPIHLIPNPYFISFVSRYRELLRSGSEGKGLLFIGEPNGYAQTVLKELLDYLATDKKFTSSIVLRPHPTEEQGSYDAILDQYSSKLAVSISGNKNILDDFLCSRVIVGMESAALALGVLCGKKTISFIPVEKITCPVPFEEIIKIKQIEELANLDSILF